MIRIAAHLQLKSRQGRRTPTDDMEVQVSLATTGETVFSTTYSEVNDLRVWELRLHICHELACAKYFSITLFQGHELLDGTARVTEYIDAACEGMLQLHRIVRELRPPTTKKNELLLMASNLGIGAFCRRFCLEGCKRHPLYQQGQPEKVLSSER